MFKKTIAMVLAVILVFSCVPAAMATEEPARLDPTDGLYSEYTHLTRGPFMYALWRFCGSPEPTIENPFTDISKSDFYYKAVLWSIEAEIAAGVTATEYAPDSTIIRAVMVTQLYRALAEEDYQFPENPFTDVAEGDFYYQPALWAYNEGYISARNEPTLFSPYEDCYYGQIHWDKSAPALDDQYWYGSTVEARPIGSNIELSFDEETGTLTFSGTGTMAWANQELGTYSWTRNCIAPWDSYAEQVTSVVLEEGITHVGSLLFRDFPNLEYVSIPESIVCVNSYAFYGCKAKNTIFIPSGMDSIADNAFSGAKNLEGVIPETVTKIGNGAFSGCTNLKGIVIPESVTELGRFAFSGCKNITEVNIPDRITVIKDSTFRGCEKLSQIYIPATVTTIELEAFDDCSSLTDVYYGGTAEQWSQVQIDFESWGGTNLALKTATIHCLAKEPETGICGDDARWVLQSNGVLTISGTGSMYDFALPTPSAIQPTAESAAAPWSEFRNRITTVVIQEGITHVGANAFSDCQNLSAAVLPDTLESAGSAAFANCNKLTNIYYSGNQEAWDNVFGDSIPENSNIYVDMPDNTFSDVALTDFYCGPVLWALENNITNGTSDSTFSPAAACNRAQVVTFLWRAAGSPEPTVTDNPFVDVEKDSFYEKAVLWAVEKGITNGTDDTHFSPDAPCNRATVVTFLYRAFENPAVENTENPFTDVPADDWYTAPVLWAVEAGITNGMGDGTFGADTTCNRAQIVTFLYRAYN